MRIILTTNDLLILFANQDAQNKNCFMITINSETRNRHLVQVLAETTYRADIIGKGMNPLLPALRNQISCHNYLKLIT